MKTLTKQVQARLTKVSAASYKKALNKPTLKNVGIELDFVFDSDPATLDDLKRAVEKVVKASGVKSVVVTPLNLEGPGGGNPNAVVVFKNMADLWKYLLAHEGDDADSAGDMLEFVVQY